MFELHLVLHCTVINILPKPLQLHAVISNRTSLGHIRSCQPVIDFQAGEEEMEGFTKEVLTMWKVLVAEGGRCIAPKAGKKGIKIPICGVKFCCYPFTHAQYGFLLDFT